MVDDTLMRDAEAAARALLDRRIELIRELTAATTELEPLQRAAAEGEQRVRDAWAEALAGGWTADELRSLGLPEPDRKTPAKKAAPKPRSAAPAPRAAAPAADRHAPPAPSAPIGTANGHDPADGPASADAPSADAAVGDLPSGDAPVGGHPVSENQGGESQAPAPA
jgi:hypothetical protein